MNQIDFFYVPERGYHEIEASVYFRVDAFDKLEELRQLLFSIDRPTNDQEYNAIMPTKLHSIALDPYRTFNNVVAISGLEITPDRLTFDHTSLKGKVAGATVKVTFVVKT